MEKKPKHEWLKWKNKPKHEWLKLKHEWFKWKNKREQHERLLRQAAETARLQIRREHGQKMEKVREEAQKMRVETLRVLEAELEQFEESYRCLAPCVGTTLLRFVTFWKYPPQALEPVSIPPNTLEVGTSVAGRLYVSEILPLPDIETALLKYYCSNLPQYYGDRMRFTPEARLQELATNSQVWSVRTEEESIDYRRETLVEPATMLLQAVFANEDARKVYRCKAVRFQRGISESCPVENERMKSQNAGFPDGYVVATGLDGAMRVAMPYECKEPHLKRFP